MNRRRFVTSTASVAAATIPAVGLASTPCPAFILGSSAQPSSCGQLTGNVLGQAANNLSTGQTVSLAGQVPFSSMSPADMAWQTSFYFDANNLQAGVFGKAPQSNPFKFETFDLATNQWTSRWNESVTIGHVYGNNTMDPATGDHYIQAWGEKRVFRYNSSTQQVSPGTSLSPIETSGQDGLPNGLGWHPNLYGPGDGGLVMFTGRRAFAWRKASDTWTVLTTFASNNPVGLSYGQAVYLPGSDAVIAHSNTANKSWKVTPGPNITEISSAPVNVEAGSAPNSHLILHPGDSGRMLILVDGGPVHQSSDGENWSSVGTNPFGSYVSGSQGYVTCSIPEYGVIWCLSPVRSILWKPA